MKNTVKCYRCGTENKLTLKTVAEEVKCPHCQGTMSLDKSSKFWFNFFKYFFILLVSLVLVTIINIFTTNILILLLTAFLIAFIVVAAADKVGIWMLYLTKGATYIHIETEKEKRNREKEEKKENKKK